MFISLFRNNGYNSQIKYTENMNIGGIDTLPIDCTNGHFEIVYGNVNTTVHANMSV